ncbi:hypothetical protein EDM57_19410 [Brevibacillus gelatini]|uniref:Uncharacterized protein n=2 Tax=Brevibacillus gelatini TaxID=1655277 RepID=A0A3M8AQI7_9BACL|nr:hypothetical protein EDM57_19410 [Brevibacillus gelatini]
MATYYYFTCQKCRTRGGVFGEQPWGWGNFDMIESFKFLAYHIRTCGEEHIRVISEEVDEYIDQLHDEYNAFLEQTKHIFPHSKDWEFLDRWKMLKVEELKEKWVEEHRIAHPDDRLKICGTLDEVDVLQKGAGRITFLATVTDRGQTKWRLVATRPELPALHQSYIIIGVRQDHPEFGEIVEVFKMIPQV